MNDFHNRAVTGFRRAAPQFGASLSVSANAENFATEEAAEARSEPTDGVEKDAVASLGDVSPIPGDLADDPENGSTTTSQDDAGARSGVQLHAAASGDPYRDFPLSVDEIRSKLFAIGISKSKDTIQRYCREGTLDCVKLGMLRRFHATEASVASLIEVLKNEASGVSDDHRDAPADSFMPLHAGARSGMQDLLQLHAGAEPVEVADNAENSDAAPTRMQVHEGASTGMQAHAAVPTSAQVHAAVPNRGPLRSRADSSGSDGVGHADIETPERPVAETAVDHHRDEQDAARSSQPFASAHDARNERDTDHAGTRPTQPADTGMIEFLKEQVRVKDDQIRVKDEQIAAMLERDRETNILIRGLQDRIGEAFGLLVSGKRRTGDDGVVDAELR